jgi:hypothetical protein
MHQKIHMQDQVFNKIEDIMNHYKKKSGGGIIRLFKQLMKKQSAH